MKASSPFPSSPKNTLHVLPVSPLQSQEDRLTYIKYVHHLGLTFLSRVYEHFPKKIYDASFTFRFELPDKEKRELLTKKFLWKIFLIQNIPFIADLSKKIHKQAHIPEKSLLFPSHPGNQSFLFNEFPRTHPNLHLRWLAFFNLAKIKMCSPENNHFTSENETENKIANEMKEILQFYFPNIAFADNLFFSEWKKDFPHGYIEIIFSPQDLCLIFEDFKFDLDNQKFDRLLEIASQSAARLLRASKEHAFLGKADNKFLEIFLMQIPKHLSQKTKKYIFAYSLSTTISHLKLALSPVLWKNKQSAYLSKAIKSMNDLENNLQNPTRELIRQCKKMKKRLPFFIFQIKNSLLLLIAPSCIWQYKVLLPEQDCTEIKEDLSLYHAFESALKDHPEAEDFPPSFSPYLEALEKMLTILEKIHKLAQ